MGVGVVLIRRAIALAIALVVIVFITGVIMSATGYDTMVIKAIIETEIRALRQQLSQKPGMSSEQIEEIIRKHKEFLIEFYGLNKPWYYRVFRVVQTVLTLKLGNSTTEEVCAVGGLPAPCRVSDLVLAVLPRTIIMLTIAEIICAAIALPIGPWLAYRRGSIADRCAITYAALFNAVPVWWLAMIFIFVLGYSLKIAPVNYRGIASALATFWKDPLMNFIQILWYSYVPITVVVISFLGSWLYYTRSMVIRIVSEDFVWAAKARGLPEKLIVRRYILRVAAPPIVTYTILSLAGSIGGFIITESVFDWPGMGTLYYQAIFNADAPVLVGLVFITTLVYIAARFVLEVLYILLDPRVRIS